MKKNKLLFFLVISFFVILLGFYIWIADQFNENTFSQKVQHYLNKNFSEYSFVYDDIKLDLSTSLQYKFSNLEVRRKEDKSLVFRSDTTRMRIPFGAFLGKREIKFYFQNAEFYSENKDEVQNYFFPSKNLKYKKEYDFPQIINNNNVSIKFNKINFFTNGINGLEVNYVFFKNINIDSFTAFEIEGYEKTIGVLRINGELNLNRFLSKRSLEVDGLLKVLKGKQGLLNETTFTIKTNKKNGNRYQFSLQGKESDIDGELDLLILKDRIKVSSTDSRVKGSFINAFLNGNFSSCDEKSKNYPVKGYLDYLFQDGFLIADLNILNTCKNLSIKTYDNGNPFYLLNSENKKNDSVLKIEIQKSKLGVSLESLESINVSKNFLNLKSFKGLYLLIKDLKSELISKNDFYAPIEVNVKNLILENESFSLESKGIISNEEVLLNHFLLKSHQGIKVFEGSLIFALKKEGVKLQGDLLKMPVGLFKLLLPPNDLIFNAGIVSGSYYLDTFDNKDEEVFKLSFRDLDGAWRNSLELLQKEFGVSKKISSLEISGKEVKNKKWLSFYLKTKENKILKGEIKSTKDLNSFLVQILGVERSIFKILDKRILEVDDDQSGN